MERYSEYKDSGIQWLGEIPSHWKVQKIFSSFSENKKKNSDFLFKKAMQFNYGKIVDKKESFDTNEVRDIYSKYTVLNKGDIVINGLNLNYDFVSQRVAIAPQNGIITSAYVVITPKVEMNSLYFCYFFKNMDSMKIFHGLGAGVRKTLSYKELRNQQIPIPPKAEQEAIVRYLDAATSKIDKAIAMQQKMIDLLNERKQIIIQKAVTKGLDENVEMKDSGIEWIGMMPKHWSFIRIKYLAKLQSGINLTSLQISDVGEFPVYGGNGKRGYYSLFNCEGEYALIGRQGALCGNINYAHGKFWATEHAVVCYPKRQYVTFWFGEVLRLMNLGQYSLASAQPGLAVERIKGLYLPWPPLEEQKKISCFLQNKMDKIDYAIYHSQRQITLLQERKQIIINEVVTGKVKVS